MSASPWANVELNKKLLSYATENVTAAVGLVEKLSRAKDVEQVVKIQTEFMSKQLDAFNEQTAIVEMCAKAAQGTMKHIRPHVLLNNLSEQIRDCQGVPFHRVAVANRAGRASGIRRPEKKEAHE
jgi:hypothetical protein